MGSLASRVPRIAHVYKGPIPFTLYIGRAFAEFPESKWHNPYHLKDQSAEERLRVAQLYKKYVKSQPDLMAALPELVGQVLGCWCWPKAPCHGNVLVELMYEQGILER